ncbi:hypothetical protein V8F33_003893 [Rhypophila sp. PSN 637]
MAPHPSQPGLEVNDSPGLEVVYMSNNDVKPTIEDRSPMGGGYHQEAATGSGYRQTNFHTSPHSQVSPLEYPQPNYYDGSDKEVAPYMPRKERKRILGLPVALFWVIILLIVAGAIGGGVGGSLAVKNAEINAQKAAAGADSTSSSSPSSSSSQTTAANTFPATQTVEVPTTSLPPTSTSSLAASTASSSNPAIPFDGGCPRVDNTRFTPRTSSGQAIGVPDVVNSQSFLRLCNTNFPGGAAYGNPGVADIFKTFASSLDECMTLCAAYNADPGSTQFQRDKGFCRSVSIVKKADEFCYLKNGTGVNNTFGAPNDFASAVLIEDLINP